MNNGLNSQQQTAIKWTEGPVLILAGAGSGKTRVLTHKVAYLIGKKHLPASQLLMLTFTNKAALEMKMRIRHQLQTTNQELPFAGTFHALCAKILRRDGTAIGKPADFVIYDSNEQKEAMKLTLIKLNISLKQYHPAAILHMISQAKNELISATQYPQYARGHFQTLVAQAYSTYQTLLTHSHALDFDDLLMYTVQLFQAQPEIARKYQQQFRYVLVDEYQDTNHAQFILTQLLSAKHRNLCVVGDASQSIYAWRGANVKNILNFQAHYPEAKIFNLEQNYRSTQVILDAAFAVISKNTTHPVLRLWTDKTGGNPVTLYEARNEQDEAREILKKIQDLQVNLRDAAVLYRTNAQSRAIEEVLLHEGVPYTLVGGVGFYERKEIKDVLSYLKYIFNPQDTIARLRIEKIGKKRAQAFDRLVTSLQTQETTLQLLEKILVTTGYLDLFNAAIEEDLERLENIKELRSVASQFPQLAEFLENVVLSESAYRPHKQELHTDALTLMTMHAAKGLEFPAVFMVGMEEGLFPHSRSLLSTDELEEERRLCYVGITRAKQSLFLTYARKRMYFGTRTQNSVSRFIADIPERILKVEADPESLVIW
ncbi:MAG: ATP-dependent DNA helicase PcrA [Candidatus Gottesmanbacteria bacterium GW2011_GWA1_43_11]|uniref:DNA 3'-5' helicase n=1 Tax=Candidatus Gottesmanbacteria bacterium GW2011_GWA1_43_11 TaxID=1618436 RepID=A0A0G1CL30_9BACT|nr:MAG: ATP-dependent DNA helicase PcrA [Candidatus Gottesmanbacteria bacterium GW2011_GWA1_43_11]